MDSRTPLLAEIPRLRRYARALTGNAAAADDLVQDTLERALAKWSIWRRDAQLRPWLFALMHNLFVDQLRGSPQSHAFVDGDEAELPPQRATQGDNLALRDLDRALARLPLEQREVLLLVALEDMSYADVARTVGIPQGTVMSRLARARARLQAILDGTAVAELKVVK